jgi:hypothetical protein
VIPAEDARGLVVKTGRRARSRKWYYHSANRCCARPQANVPPRPAFVASTAIFRTSGFADPILTESRAASRAAIHGVHCLRAEPDIIRSKLDVLTSRNTRFARTPEHAPRYPCQSLAMCSAASLIASLGKGGSGL